MRQELAEIANKLQGLKHETSHALVVMLLKERLENVKNQLVEAAGNECINLQGRAQECRTLLQRLTGDHPSKLA